MLGAFAWCNKDEGFDTSLAISRCTPLSASCAAVDLSTLPSKIQAVPLVDVANGSVIALSWWVYVVTNDGATRTAQHAIAICQGSEQLRKGGEACVLLSVIR